MKRINLLFQTIVLLSVLGFSSCNKSGLELYISPEGNDTNNGSINAPFGSLEAARNYLRTLDAEEKKKVTIYLREGEYRLDKTFVLRNEDSAPEGGSITYAAYKNERPVIHSGIKIVNWQRLNSEVEGLTQEVKAKVWVADIPEAVTNFLTMYQGDARLPRARSVGFVPDTDLHPRDNPSPEYDRTMLYYPEGMMRNWENLQDVELFIIPSYPWWMNILNFDSVDEEKRIARTTLKGTNYLSDMVSYCRGGEGYESTTWLENALEFLDEPGEWVVNTTTRKIYLWPTTEEPTEIFIPKLRQLVLVEGKNDQWGDEDQPVSGINFVGLSFTKADRGVWEEGDQGIQHDWEMLDKDNAMLRFRGAEHCKVENCRFFNAGGNAIRMDLYAQHIDVEGCLFHHLGQSAVMMLGYGLGKKDVNKNNRVYNNHIHNCGEIYWHSQMITAWQSGENYIGHNYVHHCPRKAVCISGIRFHWLSDPEKDKRECVNSIRWSEIGEPRNFKEMLPFLHSRDNIIEYNEVHDVLVKLGDGAAINLSGAGTGNIVRFNYVHDIDALNPSGAIRTDNDQNESLIENNIIYNISSAGICPKGENMYRNNYIINACTRKKSYGIIRGIGQHEGGLTDLEHNIFYNTIDKAEFYSFYKYQNYSQDEIQEKTIDYNLYFSPTKKENEWKSLSYIRSLSYDMNSQYADPLFEDLENRDFTLKSESPALKMGIEQIDIGKVGLTEEYKLD